MEENHLISIDLAPLNCNNCIKPFDLTNFTPYKIPCGHTGTNFN